MRKILRPFADFTKEEITSEAQAIIQLYSHGTLPNLVEIYSHGWLDEARGWYHIDMELCACNLEEYIQGQVEIPVQMRTMACPGPFVAIGQSMGPWQKWNILEQIVMG